MSYLVLGVLMAASYALGVTTPLLVDWAWRR